MPKPGDILWYKDFEFEDGSKKDKLFVVLNAVDNETPCRVLKTTSQPQRYLNSQQGCNPGKKVFFVPTKWQSCFSKDTFIQLPQIFEFSAAELIRGGLHRQIEVKNAISSDCLAQLKNCLKKFKDDISERHWNFIFKS
jgi:hypothetical protein